MANRHPWDDHCARYNHPRNRARRPPSALTNMNQFGEAMRVPSAERAPENPAVNEDDFADAELSAAIHASLQQNLDSANAAQPRTTEDGFADTELRAAVAASLQQTQAPSNELGVGPSTRPLGTHHPLGTQLDGTAPPAVTSPHDQAELENGENVAHSPTQDVAASSPQSPDLPAVSTFPNLAQLNEGRYPYTSMLDTILGTPEVPPAPPPSGMANPARARTSPGGTQHLSQPPSYVDLSEALRDATADSQQPSPQPAVASPVSDLALPDRAHVDLGREVDSDASAHASKVTRGDAPSRSPRSPRSRRVDDADADADDESSRSPSRQRLSGGPIPGIGRNWITADNPTPEPTQEDGGVHLDSARPSGGATPIARRNRIAEGEAGPSRRTPSRATRIPELAVVARRLGLDDSPRPEWRPGRRDNSDYQEAQSDSGHPDDEHNPLPALPRRQSSSWISVSDHEDYTALQFSLIFDRVHENTWSRELLEAARRASREDVSPLHIPEGSDSDYVFRNIPRAFRQRNSIPSQTDESWSLMDGGTGIARSASVENFMPGPLRRSRHVSFENILQDEDLQREMARTVESAPGPHAARAEGSGSVARRGADAAERAETLEAEFPAEMEAQPEDEDEYIDEGYEELAAQSTAAYENGITTVGSYSNIANGPIYAPQPVRPLPQATPRHPPYERAANIDVYRMPQGAIVTGAPSASPPQYPYVPHPPYEQPPQFSDSDSERRFVEREIRRGPMVGPLLTPSPMPVQLPNGRPVTPNPSPATETSDESDGLVMPPARLPPAQSHQHMNGHPRGPDNMVLAAARGRTRERSFNPGPPSEDSSSDISRTRRRRGENVEESNAASLVRQYATMGDRTARERLGVYDRRMHSPLEGTVNVVDPHRPANSTEPVPHAFPPDYMQRALRAVEFGRNRRNEPIIRHDDGEASTAEVVNGSMQHLRANYPRTRARSRSETEVAQTMRVLHGSIENLRGEQRAPEAPVSEQAPLTFTAPSAPGVLQTAGAPQTATIDFGHFQAPQTPAPASTQDVQSEELVDDSAQNQQADDDASNVEPQSAHVMRLSPGLRRHVRSHWARRDNQGRALGEPPALRHEYNMSELLNAVNDYHDYLLLRGPLRSAGLVEHTHMSHWRIASRIAETQIQRMLVLWGVQSLRGLPPRAYQARTLLELVESHDFLFFQESYRRGSWPAVLPQYQIRISDDISPELDASSGNAQQQQTDPSEDTDLARTRSLPTYLDRYTAPSPQPLSPTLRARLPVALPPQPRNGEAVAVGTQRLDSIADQGGAQQPADDDGNKVTTEGHEWPEVANNAVSQ